eukprot:scaffold407_cov251-Pinguiococcus_pyrenoidosus.AAC.9
MHAHTQYAHTHAHTHTLRTVAELAKDPPGQGHPDRTKLQDILQRPTLSAITTKVRFSLGTATRAASESSTQPLGGGSGGSFAAKVAMPLEELRAQAAHSLCPLPLTRRPAQPLFAGLWLELGFAVLLFATSNPRGRLVSNLVVHLRMRVRVHSQSGTGAVHESRGVPSAGILGRTRTVVIVDDQVRHHHDVIAAELRVGHRLAPVGENVFRGYASYRGAHDVGAPEPDVVEGADEPLRKVGVRRLAPRDGGKRAAQLEPVGHVVNLW